MSIVNKIQEAAVVSLKNLYQLDATAGDVPVNLTKPEFEGDYTIVLFGYVKQLKKSPDAIGQELGNELLKTNPELFSSFNLIKGFLNLTILDTYWLSF